MTNIEMTMDEFDRYIRMGENYKTAEEELVGWNIYHTYEVLSKKNGKTMRDLALLFLCKYLINCVKADPKNCDYYDEHNVKIMKKAGTLFNAVGGRDYMMDMLYAYVPKRYRREVDQFWDGIGGWRS